MLICISALARRHFTVLGMPSVPVRSMHSCWPFLLILLLVSAFMLGLLYAAIPPKLLLRHQFGTQEIEILALRKRLSNAELQLSIFQRKPANVYNSLEITNSTSSRDDSHEGVGSFIEIQPSAELVLTPNQIISYASSHVFPFARL